MPKPRRVRQRAALLLPLLLTSCFTMGLWGYLPDEEVDPVTGATEATISYEEKVPSTQWPWWARVLLTPVALGLDLLTAPVQCFLLGDDDECDQHR